MQKVEKSVRNVGYKITESIRKIPLLPAGFLHLLVHTSNNFTTIYDGYKLRVSETNGLSAEWRCRVFR